MRPKHGAPDREEGGDFALVARPPLLILSALHGVFFRQREDSFPLRPFRRTH